MAEINADDLQNAMDDIARTLSNGMRPTVGQLQTLANAANTSSGALDGLKSAGLSAASSLTGMAGQLGRGNTNFSVLNSAVQTTGSVLGSFADKIPFVGKAIGSVAEGLADVASFAIERFDEAFITFERLSQAGAIGAEGVTGFVDQLKRSGMPMAAFEKIVISNAAKLAMLTGSVTDATDQFSTIMGDMRAGLDSELRNLGFSTDEIGEPLATFATLQKRLGFLQQLDQEKIRQGTIAYGKELDAIAKLTGQSRKEAQAEMERAASEGRFRAALTGMEQEQAQQLQSLNVMLAKMSPTLAQGIRDISTGFINSEAARKVFLSTSGDAAGLINALKSGQKDAYNVFSELQPALQQTAGVARNLSLAMGDSQSTFIPFAEQMDFANKTIQDRAEWEQQVINAQKAQAGGSDAMTGSLAEAKKNLETAGNEINTLMLSSNLAATAIDKMAWAMKELTTWINNTLTTGVFSDDKETYTRQLTVEEIRLSTLQETNARLQREANQANSRLTFGPKEGSIHDKNKKAVDLKTSELEAIQNEIKDLAPIVEKQINATTTSVKDVILPQLVNLYNGDQDRAKIAYQQLSTQVGIGDFLNQLGIANEKDPTSNTARILNQKVDDIINILKTTPLVTDQTHTSRLLGMPLFEKEQKALSPEAVNQIKSVIDAGVELKQPTDVLPAQPVKPKEQKALSPEAVNQIKSVIDAGVELKQPTDVLPAQPVKPKELERVSLADPVEQQLKQPTNVSTALSGYKPQTIDRTVIEKTSKEPVEVASTDNELRQTTQQTSLLEQQISKLTEIAHSMKENIGVNQKILQVARA